MIVFVVNKWRVSFQTSVLPDQSFWLSCQSDRQSVDLPTDPSRDAVEFSRNACWELKWNKNLFPPWAKTRERSLWYVDVKCLKKKKFELISPDKLMNTIIFSAVMIDVNDVSLTRRDRFTINQIWFRRTTIKKERNSSLWETENFPKGDTWLMCLNSLPE